MKQFQKSGKMIRMSLLAVILSAGTAIAQEQPEGQGTPEGQTAVPAPGAQTPPEVKEDFSDETLEKFVDINMKLAPHQQEAQGQMIKAIEDEGLEAQRFDEIMRARQMNDSINAGASDEEVRKVEAATQKLMGIQQKVQQTMTKVIVEEGMEIQEFQDIALAYQYSPKVQQKIDSMIERERSAGDSTTETSDSAGSAE